MPTEFKVINLIKCMNEQKKNLFQLHFFIVKSQFWLMKMKFTSLILITRGETINYRWPSRKHIFRFS